MKDPYVDENGVLKNKLGIDNAADLKEAERDFTGSRISELRENPIKGSFDFKHLQKIHGHIFQDVYDWAGKTRTVEIAKGNMFCSTRFIDSYQQGVFDRLRKDDFLKDMSREQFSKEAAFYLGEINMLHPFREGNGRTQREFMLELSREAGWELDLSKVSREEMIQASQQSANSTDDLFEKMIREQLKPMELVKKEEVEKILSSAAEKDVKRMTAKERFTHYAKHVLETDAGVWLPDTNKRIAMAMMRDGFSARDAEYSMKNSPQRVSSMSKFLGKAERSNEALGIAAGRGGKSL